MVAPEEVVHLVVMPVAVVIAPPRVPILIALKDHRRALQQKNNSIIC